MDGQPLRLVVDNSSEFSESDQGERSVAKRQKKNGTSDCVARYALHSPQRVEDATALAEYGLSMRSIHQLTQYPPSLISHLIQAAGHKPQGGRRRSRAADLVRNPLFHSALSMYVISVQKLLSANNGKLDARVFITSLRYFSMTTRGTIVMIPSDLLYALTLSLMDGTTLIKHCHGCRSTYAYITESSGLVRGTPYECPGCREMGALVGGVGTTTKNQQDRIPKSLSQLGISRPLYRFPSQVPPSPIIRGALAVLVN